MPFELIVQSAFTERLEGGGVRIRTAGDHIREADQVTALDGNPHVVRIWSDDPPPSAELSVDDEPADKPDHE